MAETFSTEVQLRWSDIDPNFHIRHSVYYDWGALCRIAWLEQHDLTADTMQKLKFGPILFREECVFRKEIRLTDKVFINLRVTRAKKDYSRWSFRHEIIKNDNILCAVLSVDGAWMDVVRRKLAIPPAQILEIFDKAPRDEAFEWV